MHQACTLQAAHAHASPDLAMDAHRSRYVIAWRILR
jgi:hypothetical protein